MGKLITTQRRGKGSLTYRSPSHRHVTDIKHSENGSYSIVDIRQSPGRSSPLLVMVDDSGKKHYQIAFVGAHVGQKVDIGEKGETAIGNTVPLGKIPDGATVYNIESMPGDGGKFCRTAGTGALVVSHGANVTVKLPSGKIKHFHPSCKASIGVIAGTGAKDIPILKSGRKIHYYQSRAKRPYTVRGVAMNAVKHPHGGGNHQHVGRPSTVGRGTPPGRKVGRLSPKKRRKS